MPGIGGYPKNKISLTASELNLEDIVNLETEMIHSDPSNYKKSFALGGDILRNLEQRKEKIDEVKYENIKEKVTQLLDNPDEKLNKPEVVIANKHFVMGASSEPQQEGCDSQKTIATKPLNLGKKVSCDVEKAEEAFNNYEFGAAVIFYKAATKSAVASRMLQLNVAECLILSDQIDEVNEIVANLAGGEITESDALCIQGMILYYRHLMHEAPEAFEKFEACLSLEKFGHKMCKRYYENAQKFNFMLDRGDYYLNRKSYIIALEMYNRGLNVDSKNRKANSWLHYKMALTNLRLLNVLEAIASSTIAISLNIENYNAFETRGKCYFEINELQNSLEDLEIVYKRFPWKDDKKLLELIKSKLELKAKCSKKFSSLSKEEQNKHISLRRKLKGNQLFSKKCYNDAKDAYSEAISLDPKCAVNFSNRSACYLVMKKPLEALADASKSLELDENFIKSYFRKGKAELMLGKGEEALRTFSEGLKIDPSNKNLKIERSKASDFIQHKTKAEEAFQKQEFIAAKRYFGKALDAVGDCSEIITKYVEVLLYCVENDYNKVSELKGRLRTDDPNYCYICALEIFHWPKSHNIQSVENNMKDVIKDVESVLSLDPNHSEAKELNKKAQQICQFYSEGQKARANNNLAEAIALFQKALLVDEHSKKLNGQTMCEIGGCFMMQKDFLKAIEQFKLSIELNDRNSSPYIKRAMCYDHLELWQESVNDYEKACKLDPYSLINQKLLDYAKLKLNKSRPRPTRKDYYKILGLDSCATMEAIRLSYKRLAKEHHPDRHSTEEDKLKGQEKFKEINEAYIILSDPLNREMYDRGR